MIGSVRTTADAVAAARAEVARLKAEADYVAAGNADQLRGTERDRAAKAAKSLAMVQEYLAGVAAGAAFDAGTLRAVAEGLTGAGGPAPVQGAPSLFGGLVAGAQVKRGRLCGDPACETCRPADAIGVTDRAG